MSMLITPTCRQLCALSLLFCSLLPVSSQAEEEQAVESDACIILLHGLGRSSLSMKAVEWRLRDTGYVVVNNSYPWLGKTIEEIAPLVIDEGLADCDEAGKTQIGFVTHSLGGIVLRQYLETRELPGLSRVVMLAPPNQGSVMAEDLLANKAIKPLMPEPARQLGTGDDSVPRQLGPVKFELGVIAGNSSRLLVTDGLEGEANDGTVTVEETQVEGMSDFIEMPVDHSFLMWRESVLNQVVNFLRDGHFDHAVENDQQSSPEAAGHQ